MSQVKVLIVDDIHLNRLVATKYMESQQYLVDQAENGKEAVYLASKVQYDIILMDCSMPVLDGFEATRCIRALPDVNKRNVPIIALTAYADDLNREKSFDCGMNAFIAKPYDKKKLIAKVNELIAKSSQQASDNA